MFRLRMCWWWVRVSGGEGNEKRPGGPGRFGLVRDFGFPGSASEFACDDHECFADAGSEAAIGLDGEEDGAFADEFDGDGAGVEFEVAAAKAEVGDDLFKSFDGVDVLLADAGDVFDAGERAGALEDFLVWHFAVHAEDGAEFELFDGEGVGLRGLGGCWAWGGLGGWPACEGGGRLYDRSRSWGWCGGLLGGER